MADLEEMGYLDHPHTSAGRIPTDKGYRYYVDSIMHVESIADPDREFIERQLDPRIGTDINDVLRHTSAILSSISKQLAIVSAPQIGSGVLQHIEFASVASNRIMIILSIASKLIRTIILELESDINREQLAYIALFLNERLCGLTLRDIRETLAERVMDSSDHGTELIRLFLNSSEKLFAERNEHDSVVIDGITSIMQQPEFSDPERLRNFLSLIENHNIIVHILDSIEEERAVTVRIGKEIAEDSLSYYSLISTPYSLGSMSGALSIFGPKRMNYPRMISILNYISKIISQ